MAHPLEDRLGVQFRDPALLTVALCHRSSLNEQAGQRQEDNERLEFLGDSVLGAVVAEALYRAFPVASEGALTIMRAELVRQESLARWARRFALGQHIAMGRGEEARGGRERDGLLSNAFEAVLGALFLDQGLDAVRTVVGPLVAEVVPGLSPATPRARDPKSELQYRSQARWGIVPQYQLLSVEGPEHGPTLTVRVETKDDITGVGKGRSKQAAEQEAASRALERWDAELPAAEARATRDAASEAGGGD